jgi:hypothetical protein
MIIKITYKCYKGMLNVHTNEVYFDNKKFKSIFEAIDYFICLKKERDIIEQQFNALFG